MLATLLCLIAAVCIPGPAAAEPAASEVSVELSSIDSEVPASQSSGSRSPAEEDVKPLDAWDEEYPQDSSSSVESSSEESSSSSAAPVPLYSSEPLPVEGASTATLIRSQKKRIEKVDKKIRETVAIEEQEKARKLSSDPRGRPEARICSINFNGYGTKEENKRVMKKVPAAQMAARERSFVRAINESRCDIVAVQGVIGRSTVFVQEALQELIKKLVKAAKKSGETPQWTAVTPRSKGQGAYQAFLLKNVGGPVIREFRTATYNELPMRAPGGIAPKVVARRADAVPRDIFQLNAEVLSADASDPLSGEKKRPREIVLLNGVAAKSVVPLSPEPAQLKMKIADALVRLLEEEQRKITPTYQPVVIAAFERMEPRKGLIEQLLTGRLELDDFASGNPCKLLQQTKDPEEEGSEGESKKKRKKKAQQPVDLTRAADFECHPAPRRPQARFNIQAWVKADSAPESKAKKKSKEKEPEETGGLYLVFADLKVAARKPQILTDFSAARVKIDNGLPGGSLLWMDVNW